MFLTGFELAEVYRAASREQLMEELFRPVDDVADAVDKAPVGRVMRDSEEPARVALDRCGRRKEHLSSRHCGPRFAVRRIS